jgi:predicted RNA-binding Zn ribbon-like protein
MSEISIKVSIAGRTYPLTLGSAEELNIRQAEAAIEESIQTFQKSYAVKDKQDLLAMASLQMAAGAIKNREPRIEKVVEKVVERIEVPVDLSPALLQLESRLDQYLV